jgi:hypothetical protein
MPYRDSARQMIDWRYDPPPSLTLRQHWLLISKPENELTKHQWYREHRGGLWCQTKNQDCDFSTNILRVYDRSASTHSERYFIDISPFIGGFAAENLWFQAPHELGHVCIHNDQRAWEVMTQNIFGSNYNMFSKMAYARQLFLEQPNSPCNCEKYSFRHKNQKDQLSP